MSRATQTLEKAVLGLGLPRGSRILVATSGGPDSVALLATLDAVRGSQSWDVMIGHVNHQLRGEASEADEVFVREVAAERGLAVEVERVDTEGYAREQKLSFESAAREQRYQGLRTMLRAWGGNVIATGHTMDDQAETVLLHLLRGSGLRGLGAMRPEVGDLVRPFLAVSRHTVLGALEEMDQAFRLDASNLDLRHRRNQIREQVLPTLGAVQPQVTPVLARTARLLQQDADYLRAEALRAIDSLDPGDEATQVTAALGPWRVLHPALRREVLRILVERLVSPLRDIDERHIAELEEALMHLGPGQSLRGRLPHALSAYVDAGRFTVRQGPRPSVDEAWGSEMSVPGEMTTTVGQLSAAPLAVPDREALERILAVCGPYHALCDATLLGERLSARSRRPGDRMRPLGVPGSRKLQDLFVDRKIPRALRSQVPVVTNRDGVVWVPGIATDHRVAVRPDTTRLIHLIWTPKRTG